MSVGELEAADDRSFDFEAAWRAVTPESIACLIYTSGTTGAPKAVQLPHRAIMHSLAGVDALAPARARSPRRLVPAQRAHHRPLHLPLLDDRARRDAHLRRRPRAAVGHAARGAADALPRRPAHVREARRPRPRADRRRPGAAGGVRAVADGVPARAATTRRRCDPCASSSGSTRSSGCRSPPRPAPTPRSSSTTRSGSTSPSCGG